MTTEFKLPEVAEGVETADVAELLVSEGDVIEAEQNVMELETEKAVVELPCPYGGKVTKIHVAPGDSVNVGDVILTIEETSEAAPAEKAPPEEETPSTEKDEEKPSEDQEAAPAAKDTPAQSEQPAAQQPRWEEAVPQRATAVESPPRDQETSIDESPPPPAGPATRRMARELGVDLHQVAGSGPGGRITQDDVQQFVRNQTSGKAASTGTMPAAPPLPDFTKFGTVERQPLNKIARTSATNLWQSWQTIPHVTQHDMADVTELEAARKQYLQTVGQSGPKITMTAIMVKAVVGALKAFPRVNSSLDYEAGELVLKKYYHIGIAVDTEQGLLVPVIRNAEGKTILEIAEELTDLAERARSRKLALEEMQGATFSITNLGGIGGTAFTPIVNYPEVAILGMSRTQKELKMVDGQPSERLMLPLSLSYDHRVINGADAARFVVKLTRSLADSFTLLMET